MRPLTDLEIRINPLCSLCESFAAEEGQTGASILLENLTPDEIEDVPRRASECGLSFAAFGSGHRLTGFIRGFSSFAGAERAGDCDVYGAAARAMRNQMEFDSGSCELAPGLSVSASAPQVWGVLNVTPDSFSDGGCFDTLEKALSMAEKMVRDGAAVIDVGGESTRPGSVPLNAEDEARRVVPVVEAVSSRLGVCVSVDTSKSFVARRAIEAGARIVNDVTALKDPAMAETICSSGCGAVLMHMQGEPRTMQREPKYSNLFGEIARSLRIALAALEDAGGAPALIDPGIGFGKNQEHNLRLLSNSRAFGSLGRRVLVGPSRKSFIGSILDLPVGQRLEGTLAASACAVLGGASVIRAHDVLQVRRAVVVAAAALRAGRVIS